MRLHPECLTVHSRCSVKVAALGVLIVVVFLLPGCRSWCPSEAAEGHRGWRQLLLWLCLPLSQVWARALGSGPKDSCAYKAAEAAEAAGGPGSGRYFGPATPSSCFSGESGGRDPWVLFLGPPLPPSLLPSLSVQRGGNRDHSGFYWEAVGSWPLAGNPGTCPTSLSRAFWRQGICLIPQDLTAGSELLREQEPWCQTLKSATAVPLNLHTACGRWSGNQQEIQAAQAPVGLCIWGCPPPTSPRHTLLGKTRRVIHLLTRAEKRVQLGTLISPLLAGMVPAVVQCTPLPGAVYPFCIPGFRRHVWSQGYTAGVQVGRGGNSSRCPLADGWRWEEGTQG